MESYVRRILELIRRYRLERFPIVAQILALADHGKLTESQARAYLPWVAAYAEQQKHFPILLHAPPQAAQLHSIGPPEVELGTCTEVDGLRFGLRPSDGAQHVFVQGRTGAGKTVTLRVLIERMYAWAKRMGRQLSFFVLDIKGGDFSDLPGRLGSEWLHYNASDDLRVGFSGPEGVPSHLWTAYVTTCMAARFKLQFGATTIRRLITWILPLLNPPGQALLYPSPGLLLDILNASPPTLFSSKATYNESTTQALEDLENTSGNLFCTHRGLIVNDIIKSGKSCVIQLANLGHDTLCLLVDLLLGPIYMDRLNRHYKTDAVDVVIVVGECDQIVSHAASAASFRDHTPPVTRFVKQGRELGAMFVFDGSRLAGTSPLILSNIHNVIMLGQINDECIRECARTLLLPPGAEVLLPALSKGRCVFRFAESGWPHATLGTIDYVPPRRDAVVKPYDNHAFAPAKRLHELPEVERALDKLIAEHHASKLRRSRRGKTGLSDNARKLLELAAKHPYMPVARLWEQIGSVRPATQKAARQQLEGALLAGFAESRIGRPNVLLIDVLEKGYELVGVEPVAKHGRGGIEHRHFAHWIAATLKRKGYKPQLEWTVPETTHPVDVAAQIEGAWHAYEVCVTSTDNVVSHLQACLVHSQVVDTVTIVTPTITAQTSLKRTVLGEPTLAAVKDRIKFEVVETYMKELFR